MPDRYKHIDVVGEKADNQYLLALAIAKRVRKLRAGAPPLVDAEDSRRTPIATAMEELAEKKIIYTDPGNQKK